jgi:hypothetical protein
LSKQNKEVNKTIKSDSVFWFNCIICVLAHKAGVEAKFDTLNHFDLSCPSAVINNELSYPLIIKFEKRYR